MRFLRNAAPLLLLALGAEAQNATFLAELLGTLQSLGLTSLVGLASSLNGTSQGNALLAQLGTHQQTIFAPNNDAFSAAANLTSNPQLVADRFAYHIVNGHFNVTQQFPNTTIGRTLLNDSSITFLEGHKNQVLAWASFGNETRILNQNTIVTVLNTTQVENITLNVIDAVIDFPGEFTAAIDANNLTSFRSALTTAGLLNPINQLHGVTIFAPTDEAFTAAQQNLTAAGSNATLLNAILKNHIINGSTVYSGDLEGGNVKSLTSGGGETINTSFNSSGAFISTGNSTAKITTPDIILWNGVLHIIDHVLLNEDSDSGAASSAASSASSAATTATSIETGPVGFTPSPTSGSGSGSSGSGGSSSSSAAGVAAQVPFMDFGVASIIATAGVMIGALLVV